MSNCDLCTEKYNKSTRKPIECPYCNYRCCLSCFKQYLLSTIQVICINPICKKELSIDFILDSTPKTFHSVYNNYKFDVLFQQQHSLLPDTQLYAKYILLNREYRSNLNQKLLQNKIIKDTMKCNRNKILEYKVRINNEPENTYKYNRKIDTIKYKNEQLKEKLSSYHDIVEAEYTIFEGKCIENGINMFGDNDFIEEKNEKEEKTKFIMACSKPECKGFLSTAWKCAICEEYTCKDCYVYIGEYQKVDKHECKKDDLETVKMIKKESKACPGCGIMISKKDGCDMMWCIDCKTPFSWKTRKILHNQHNHNPHYYEYLRKNGGVVPRNPGDNPGINGCNDEMYQNIERILDIYRRHDKGNKYDAEAIANSHRLIGHTNYILRNDYNNYNYVMGRPNIGQRYKTEEQSNNKLRDYRVGYILNELKMEDWKKVLKKEFKQIEKNKYIRMILEMFINTLKTIFNNYIGLDNQPNSNIKKEIKTFDLYNQLENIREYTNDNLDKIHKRYSCVVPYINDDFEMISSSQKNRKDNSYDDDFEF